jgi:hypothetical protein
MKSLWKNFAALLLALSTGVSLESHGFGQEGVPEEVPKDLGLLFPVQRHLGWAAVIDQPFPDPEVLLQQGAVPAVGYLAHVLAHQEQVIPLLLARPVLAVEAAYPPVKIHKAQASISVVLVWHLRQEQI